MCIRDRGGAVDATANKLEAETIAAKIKAGAKVKVDTADAVTAVSYTHLDVYKRQAHNRL